MPNTESLKHKQYLGDAVYAGFDGYHVWIWLAESHEERSARDGIALEPSVLAALDRYREWLKEILREEKNNA